MEFLGGGQSARSSKCRTDKLLLARLEKEPQPSQKGQMIRTTLFLTFAASLTCSAWAEKDLHAFRRIELSDQFWCEGANAADFNNDGQTTSSPDRGGGRGRTSKKRHEITPATATFELAAGRPDHSDGARLRGRSRPQKHLLRQLFRLPAGLQRRRLDGHADHRISRPGSPRGMRIRKAGMATGRGTHVLTQTDNESPTFTDITGDGKPELVCITEGALRLCRSRIGQMPAKPWTWHAISPKKGYGNFTHGMGVGDVNGDGRMDLLEKDGWWEQPGSLRRRSGAASTSTFAGAGGAQMYAYDVNGDGLNDVITSLAAHGFGLAWYEQVQGTGRHQLPRAPHHEPTNRREPLRREVLRTPRHRPGGHGWRRTEGHRHRQALLVARPHRRSRPQ